jgi:hypothetical protein
MFRLFLVASCAIIVSGCATSTPEPEVPEGVEIIDVAGTERVAQSAQSEMVCTRKPVTGSRIGVKTCRTRAQIDQERKDAQGFLQRAKTRSMKSHVGDG